MKFSKRQDSNSRPNFSSTSQRQTAPNQKTSDKDAPTHTHASKKGDHSQSNLPTKLRQGMEQLSGLSLNDVRVHYNSNKPASLDAHAYANGNDIFLGSGQEKYLPHEAWHVVQQKQGRVQPTAELNGQSINSDVSLENEADQMGSKAMNIDTPVKGSLTALTPNKVTQGYFIKNKKSHTYRVSDDKSTVVREGYPNHHLYALSDKAAQANQNLKKVGSGIELKEQSSSLTLDNKLFKRVLPTNTQNHTKGDKMKLWDDCGESAAVVVGGKNSTALYTNPAGEQQAQSIGRFPILMKTEIMLKVYKGKLLESSTNTADKKTISTILQQATSNQSKIYDILRSYTKAKTENEKATLAASYENSVKDHESIIMPYYNSKTESERDAIDQKVKINKYSNPEVGQGYTMSSGGKEYPDKSWWVHHWGGVVMESNDKRDKVTLENYALNGPQKVENNLWDFAMYGTHKEGQTFHEQHRDTKQHGNKPITMTIEEK